MEIHRNATRIINGMAHTVTTINGMDRVQINLRLQHLSEEMNKLKAKRDRMLAMSDALDRECEMQERAENANNLFDEMFGG